MTQRRSIDPIRSALGASVLSIMLGACGSSAPSKQLVDARSTYQMAQASGAEQLAPTRMQDARQALNTAESAHAEKPGSNHEANLAYVAQRKAQIAIASGKLVSALQTEQAANEQYRAHLEQTAQGRQALQQREEQAQAQAAADALESLHEVATVTETQQGKVITLSGAVLFQTDGDTLSEEARARLDKVAQALAQQPAETQIRVEGYTDATGAPDTNEELSQRRADAVRDYLAQRGVQGSMLDSIGRGEARPVATNATEEGRAENRRAEIVVKLPEAAPAKKGRPSSSAKTPEEPKE